ncbi:MAG: Phosphoribosylamine--glycine ligase [Candidatus Thorarchaeota archaeon]|nr:MAG: Phosphoribosylamine--glycine ligase [Candidatus Thorarchaeota archaeon]
MSKVLLIGNGAREHAIASALTRADVELHAHMDKLNPGIAALATSTTINTLMDYRKLPPLSGFDYAVIGPEGPLSVGIADYLEGQGVPSIGPIQRCAKIEVSKSFAREIIQKAAKRANPEFAIVRSLDGIQHFEEKVGVDNIVVKPDGLTGGKGVKIFGEHLHSREELEAYATEEIGNHGIVILEEKLVGTEFTVQSFVDGKNIEIMPLVRDYKRAYDNDEGPNTGSMGSYSRSDHNLAYVSDNDLEEAKKVMTSVVKEIKKRTRYDYKGILYGQFMKTNKGPKVIEFNARFGDPEAMNVLSILDTSMDDICLSIIDGKLIKPEFREQATVCVYVVPEGYPGKSVQKDKPITIEEGIQAELYYASVYQKDEQVFTTGSRSLGVLGKGASISEARKIAYDSAQKITGAVRFRSDIAKDIT